MIKSIIEIDRNQLPSFQKSEFAFTRSGIRFDPNESTWKWVDGPFSVSLDFKRLNASSELIEELKQTLMIFAKGHSPGYLIRLFTAFNHFESTRNVTTQLEFITVQDVANYAAHLQEQGQPRLGVFNVLLQKWGALHLTGIDRECLRYLRERRKPGAIKGNAVRTRDPVKGPFSEEEYVGLYKAVDDAYSQEVLPLWAFILTRLLFACGGRISQYASLKIRDFIIDSSSSEFSIQLPQAKTRGAHARAFLQKHDLSPQTGRLIQQYIEELAVEGFNEESPLFPDTVVMVRGPLRALRPKDNMFFRHCTSATLSNIFKELVGNIAPLGERVGFLPINVSPRRFRYTFGTRLAEEGASKVLIADRLGHTDLQNVDVYFEASPKIVENIDKALDVQLAPLAEAFRGRLIENEDHSTHKGASGSRIIDFRASPQPVGSCGSKAHGCSFNKPVACYICFKFEPWLDAPHQKVLDRLVNERSRFAGDERMAAINDEAIRAAKQIIAECELIRDQRSVTPTK